MKKKIFSSLASLTASFFVVSIFSLPSFQIFPSSQTESAMTEYGSNFPWKIEQGETIYSIAEKWYGDKSFSTTIWNDNSWIENPNFLEVGWVLEMKRERPILPETLKPELEAKKILLEGGSYAVVSNTTTFKPAITRVESVSNYSGGVLNDAQIEFLGQCESGMTPTRNSGNGYFGAFQFSVGTWNSMGTEYERADLAPLDVQKDAVQRLVARSSIYGQFPGCSRRMQAMGMI